jgi:DNA-binding Xre family transcriptional regulator
VATFYTPILEKSSLFFDTRLKIVLDFLEKGGILHSKLKHGGLKMDENIVGNQKLWALLKLRKITQKKLAAETGLPPAYLSRFMNGTQIPTTGQAELIADALDVDVEEIFG